MPCNFLDLTLATAAENLALDEALLLDAEAGGPEVLRVWSWLRPTVVLGAGGKWAEEVEDAACRADKVPVLRRSSGGGTVLLGPGCLLYSLVMSYERHPALRDVNASYRHILGQIARALGDLAPGGAVAGTSDLAMADRKFSGNSQQRKRHGLLHHGTLLHAFDLALIARYLKQPARQPDYRRRREHGDFLMNLAVDASELTRRLRVCWHAQEPLATWPQAKVRELVDEKYGKDKWTRRR
jgi:lipoate-protein ligase A